MMKREPIGNHVVVFEPWPVRSLPPGFLPQKYLNHFGRNDIDLAPCCRRVEDHKVEIRKTNAALPAPDLTIFYCECGCVPLRAVKVTGFTLN